MLAFLHKKLLKNDDDETVRQLEQNGTYTEAMVRARLLRLRILRHFCSEGFLKTPLVCGGWSFIIHKTLMRAAEVAEE